MKSRNIWSIFVAVVISMVMVDNLSAGNAFFTPAPAQTDNLPANKLYPQGQLFPISGYSPHPKHYQQLVDAGFNALGPVYSDPERVSLLKFCKKANIFCFKQITAKLPNGKDITHATLKSKDWKPNWQQIAASLTVTIKKYAEDQTIAWWFITPEELRYWKKHELKFVEVAAQAIRAADPLKRPVLMYAPGHRQGKELAHIGRFLDIIGKGTYTNYSGFQDNRIWVKWSMEQELKALEIIGDPKKIAILIPEMYTEPKPEDIDKIRSWVRHDVYLGMISGAKGLHIFSLYPRKSLPSHQKWFDAYCETASELNKKFKLGQVFLFGTPKKDLSVKILTGPKIISCKPLYGSKFKVSPVNFANIALESKRYLIVVNSANEQAVTVEFAGFPQQAIKALDAFANKPATTPVNGKLKLTLAPLEVKCFIFSKK